MNGSLLPFLIMYGNIHRFTASSKHFGHNIGKERKLFVNKKLKIFSMRKLVDSSIFSTHTTHALQMCKIYDMEAQQILIMFICPANCH